MIIAIKLETNLKIYIEVRSRCKYAHCRNHQSIYKASLINFSLQYLLE